MKNSLSEYEIWENRSSSPYNRKCIDGTVIGCSNCVAYCKYDGHSGFLSEKLRRQHDCIKKGCKYYVPRQRTRLRYDVKSCSDSALQTAQRYSQKLDDVRFLKAFYDTNTWVFWYVTVFGGQDIETIENDLSFILDAPVELQKLDYSFDRRVELMCMA